MNLFFFAHVVVGDPTSRLDLAERRRGFIPGKEMLAGAVVSSFDSKDNCIVSDYYHSCDDMSLDGWTEAWMHEVPDSKKLGRMTFPGTHDSAALHNEPGLDAFAKCNSLSITEQLQAGIRYFDIRLKKRGPGMVIPGGVPTGNTLWVWHGAIFQKASFRQVLTEMADFLDANPSEGFFMRIYEEGGGGYEKVADFRDLVQDHLVKYLGTDRLAPTQGKVTDALTLGQIRGKVIILQDFGGENWVDGAMHYDSLRIESDWDIPNESDLERKKKGILRHLETANDNGDGLYFTGFAATGTNFGGVKAVAKKMNGVVQDSDRWNNVANIGKPYGFGLLIFDFPGKKLIQEAILKNYVDFPSSQYKETPCDVIDGHPIAFLDRHNVQCGPGQALVEWTLSKDVCTGNHKRILYTCEKASLHLTEQPFEHFTGCSELKENTLENLDRQTGIECPNGSVLKGFQLGDWHCNGNDMQFRVTCQKLMHAGPVQNHETGCSEIVGKTLEFLDRQRLTCPVGTGMSRFTMTRGNCQNANDKKFEFTCTELGSTPYHDTGCNPIAKKKLEWLDRHRVQCPPGHVLTEWTMDKNTCEGDEKAIVYRCEKANLNLIDAPVEIYSGCDQLRGENLEFLDRLDDIYCPVGSVMQGFHLVQGSCSGNNMQLRFTCQKLLNPGNKRFESTGCNEIAKQGLEFLDRHRLACPAGTAMHGFQMFKKHCNENDKLFESVCMELGHTPWHETECENVVDEKMEFLDRHAVLCGADEVLTEWVMDKSICPEKKMALQYKCEKANLKGSPVDHFSACTKLRGEGIAFLDRQNDVKCPAGWAMKGYQLQQGSCTGDDMQYRFKCQELESPGKVVTTKTDCQKRGNLENLDRHRPKCNDGFAMAGFEMFTNKCPADELLFEVTCRELTN